MKDKKFTQKSRIPLENLFFNQSIKAQQKHVFEDLLGWVRWVQKIEFQHRGHPHIHAAEFLGKNGHDLYKIFKNDGKDLDDVKEEIDKMHKVFNRFVTRMNYLSQYLISKPTDEDDDHEMETKPWYKQFFVKKGEKLPKVSDTSKNNPYKKMSILQLMNIVREKYDANDVT